jgi:tetratricopeptide (TPR) repeat protein
VNGGLCGLAGLLGLIVVIARASPARQNSRDAGDEVSNASATTFVVIGGVSAFAAAFVAGLYLDGVWDDRLLVLGAAWCAMFWLLPSRFAGTAGATAALVTLGVHLLGAGGLGMPGVMQMAFVWLAAAAGSGTPAVEASPFKSRVAALILMLVGVLIAQGVWRPAMAAQVGIEAGDAAFRRADVQSASIAFHRASADDRWSPTAPARLAELEFQRFRRLDPSDRQATSADSEPFRSALFYLEEARHRDPNSVIWIRRQAELWLALHERTQDRTHAARALDLFQEAARRYPTHAELLVQLSDAAAAAGEMVSSTDAAGRAIQQDDLNRRLGHAERILPSPTRLRLGHRTTKRNSSPISSESGQ